MSVRDSCNTWMAIEACGRSQTPSEPTSGQEASQVHAVLLLSPQLNQGKSLKKTLSAKRRGRATVLAPVGEVIATARFLHPLLSGRLQARGLPALQRAGSARQWRTTSNVLLIAMLRQCPPVYRSTQPAAPYRQLTHPYFAHATSTRLITMGQPNRRQYRRLLRRCGATIKMR